MTNQPTPQRLAELRAMPYEEYLKTPEWQEKRKLALERAKFRCQLCNSPESLNVHHRTYEKGRGNEDIADLTVLCEEHHSRFHDALMQETAFQSIGEIMQNFVNQERSVSTGYQDLDRVLGGGLHKSNLILMGGRSGDGKSALALNVIHNVVRNGKSAIIFSLEMNRDQVLKRLVAMDSGIKVADILRGELDDEDWEKILSSLGTISSLPLYICDEIVTVDFIDSQIQQFIVKHKQLDLVVVDYVSLIKTDKYTTRQYAERTAICALKLLARKFDIPIVALCPLPRSIGGRQDKVPQLAHFESEQDANADTVLLLYREEVFNSDTNKVNQVDILVPKNSNGLTGEVTLYFQKECMQFSNIPGDE